MNYFKLKLHRLTHWEYWPFELVYYPLFPVWLYFAFKAKSFFFFNAANPSIKNGGMAMESKKEIYDLIPEQFIPKTILVDSNESTEEILSKTKAAGISFPLIAKPDIGMKAFAVYKIADKKEFVEYQNKIAGKFLVQELITFENEVGIFFVRFPDEKQGKITGIVSKEFLSVSGNGLDTIEQLIKRNPRSYFQLNELKKKYGDFLNAVLRDAEEFILVPYGSHTRGAKFVDFTSKQNEKLLQTINNICSTIKGFYFGRLDIRYNTFEELCAGEKFSIIEINGAGSEPTHIYDPRHTILFAWKEIIRHWRMLYQISNINKKKGVSYMSFKEGKEMLRANSELEALLKLI